MIKYASFAGLALLQLLFLSCAHQMVPGGGPDDRTGPSIISANPSYGMVDVPLNTTIRLIFSEWISPAQVAKSLTILPPLKDNYRVRISGKQLEIDPTGSLADSTTYHIVLTSTLQDLRQNPIPTPFNLVFSTGGTLDSGQLHGCVIDPVTAVIQPKVALYRAEPNGSADSLFGAPDYFVQTDSSGNFTFKHIRRGIYRAIAFIDVNGDARLQAGKEQAYAPSDSLILVDSSDTRIMLFPAHSDTAYPSVESLKPLSSSVLRGKWNKPFDAFWNLKVTAWYLERVDTSSSLPIGSYTLLPNKTDFVVITAAPMTFAGYRLIYAMHQGIDTATIRDTLRFNARGISDTIGPILANFSTGGISDLSPELRLTWSEPVQIKESSLILADSVGDSVALSFTAGITDTSIFMTKRKLKPGNRYTLRLRRDKITDLAGNVTAIRDTTDTTSLALSVETLPPDSFAISLKGGATCPEKSPMRKWLFRPLGKTREYLSADSAGHFSFDSIPGGKGTIALFDDLDGNGRHDAGHLKPWKSPEPYIPFGDTIEARARWEVEDIFVPTCDPCSRVKKTVPATITDSLHETN